MINDADKVKSAGIRISVRVWDEVGKEHVCKETFIAKVNCQLGEVGTVVQREAYELLRQAVDAQKK